MNTRMNTRMKSGMKSGMKRASWLEAIRTTMLVLLPITLLLVPTPPARANDFRTLDPDRIELREVPGREGLEAAILHGNPDEPGLYVIRVRFGPGRRSTPHSHDRDRHVTVISGRWHFGIGESGGCEGTTPLGPGSYAYHPAGAIHYDGSCGDEATTVEIVGLGPVRTTWLEAASKP